MGQSVVRVDIANGTISEFLALKAPTTAFSPTDVKFHDDNGKTALYLVDWGNILPPTVPHTGVVWKITHES